MKQGLLVVGVVILIVIIAGGWLAFQALNSNQTADLAHAPAVEIAVSPSPFEDEIIDRLVDRFIATSEEFEAAFDSGPPAQAIASVSPELDPWRKTEQDILDELMAKYVYIQFRKLNDVREGKFYHKGNRRKTPWLVEDGFLAGAKLASLDHDRALVTMSDATTELLLVPLEPPPYDPEVPRTPEQIAQAQRRYREFYYREFVIQGKEYNRLAGRDPDFQMPPREEQLQQRLDYFEQLRQGFEESGALDRPAPNLVDPENFSPAQRKAYETYRDNLNRSPEEMRAILDERIERIKAEQAELEQNPSWDVSE